MASRCPFRGVTCADNVVVKRVLYQLGTKAPISSVTSEGWDCINLCSHWENEGSAGVILSLQQSVQPGCQEAVGWQSLLLVSLVLFGCENSGTVTSAQGMYLL